MRMAAKHFPPTTTTTTCRSGCTPAATRVHAQNIATANLTAYPNARPAARPIAYPIWQRITPTQSMREHRVDDDLHRTQREGIVGIMRGQGIGGWRMSLETATLVGVEEMFGVHAQGDTWAHTTLKEFNA